MRKRTTIRKNIGKGEYMTDENSGGEVRNAIHKASGGVVLWGIIVVLAGTWSVLSPIITVKAVSILLGIGIGISGVSALASAFKDEGAGHKLLDILLGLFSLLAALFLVFNPVGGALTLGSVVMILLFARGLISLFLGFQAANGRNWILLSAAVDLLLAFLLYRMGPAGAAVTIGLFVGLSMIIWGFRMIFAGRAVHSLTS
jgi:uncharacterized membrane protein HdeD (DUF308 family)